MQGLANKVVSEPFHSVELLAAQQIYLTPTERGSAAHRASGMLWGWCFDAGAGWDCSLEIPVCCAFCCNIA